MIKGQFFYNYTAQKRNSYDKFSYGTFILTCDDSKNFADEGFNEMKKIMNDEYPDADSLNLTAFNRID